jgi:probable rRNA maturation factor
MTPVPALRVAVQFAARRPWVPTATALRRWARDARATATRPGRRTLPTGTDLCIRIVGSAASRRLNRDYRGKDQPTNVLSFPAGVIESALGDALGDLVICAPVVAAEARAQGKSAAAHWAHMVVHGVLHLHGFDHENARDARVMEGLEVVILRGFGYQDPYRLVTPQHP